MRTPWLLHVCTWCTFVTYCCFLGPPFCFLLHGECVVHCLSCEYSFSLWQPHPGNIQETACTMMHSCHHKLLVDSPYLSYFMHAKKPHMAVFDIPTQNTQAGIADFITSHKTFVMHSWVIDNLYINHLAILLSNARERASYLPLETETASICQQAFHGRARQPAHMNSACTRICEYITHTSDDVHGSCFVQL